MRLCPICKGTGLDKALHQRYTTGGHDDRSCKRCHGECYIDGQEIRQEKGNGEAMSSTTTIAKRKKAQRMAVILPNVPKGINWGWYSREETRMHLQTVDSKNRNVYKVWLEKNGKRIFEPATPIPGKILGKLEAVANEQPRRGNVEARWVELMIENGWLKLHMRGSLITLVAYPHVPGSRFTRTVDLADYLRGIYDPNSKMWPKTPVQSEDVVLSSEMAAIEIWPQKDQSHRYHIYLPDILWED